MTPPVRYYLKPGKHRKKRSFCESAFQEVRVINRVGKPEEKVGQLTSLGFYWNERKPKPSFGFRYEQKKLSENY